MNRKFVLTLILAVVMISVIAFSACGFTAIAAEEDWEGYDYPSDSKLSPGFSGYTPADQIVLAEGEELTPITDEMMEDPWMLYQTMRSNQGKVSGYAQVTNTVSKIKIVLTKTLILIPSGTSTYDAPITQYASYMTSRDGNGNTYSQTISQMDQLLPGLNSIAENFGVWEKSAYIADTNTNYWQEANTGSRKFDETAPAGVTADWMGKPTETEGSSVTYNRDSFDMTKRVFADEEKEDYKVFTGNSSELGEYADSKKNEKNASNWDEQGNRVIAVQFKGSDGNWSGKEFYIWDTQEVTADGRYVSFDRDRHYKALPSRGDGISNYLVNEYTFDQEGSNVEKKQDESGNVYYVVNVKLKENLEKGYTWELITSGEFAALQGGIIDFIGFSAVDSKFLDELTLTYEVWDTGVIRRVLRQYSIASDGDKYGGLNKMPLDAQIDILNGSSKAYGEATNTQIQEYAYGGDTLNIDDSPMYEFAQGSANKWVVLGVGVGCGAAVLIALIVTLVVLAKKGIIGKKKNKKAAETAGEGADAENKE